MLNPIWVQVLLTLAEKLLEMLAKHQSETIKAANEKKAQQTETFP